ncbi:MAG: hypothetical protein IJ944_01960 [Clostridia bacterium]|nr:hypothetical protein [Clostridia bacterium]
MKILGKAKSTKQNIVKPQTDVIEAKVNYLPKYSFGLLVVAFLYATFFHALCDAHNQGTNFVPVVFLILALVGITLYGVVVLFKDNLLSKEIIITSVIGAIGTSLLLLIAISSNQVGMMVGVMGLTLILASGLYMYKTKTLTTEKMIFLLIATGFILRLAYIFYTDVGVAGISTQDRQHDVFYFNSDTDNFRHSSYIEWFYNNLSLPKVKPEGLNQYYHPPLHHFISAMWMRVMTTLGMSYNGAVESIQLLSLFYSSACMIISAKILQFIKLKGMALILPLSVICFHPTLIIMSGSVNNDMLSVALAFGGVYATMVWYKNPTIKNIIVVALCIGGSMMSKLSGGLIAPAVAVVFLVGLIKNIKKHGVDIDKGIISMLPQFGIFALICVPLGLWWQIRTATLFNVPLTYVPSLAENSSQFLGEYSTLERLFGMPIESLKNIFVIWDTNGFNYNEYSIFLGLIKTALFGEFTLFNVAYGNTVTSVGNIFCYLLFISCIILTAFAILSIVHSFVKKKYIVDLTLTVMFLLVGLVILINYVKFCFDYPFTCTQNFRYCVPLLLVGATFTGNLYTEILNNKDKFSKIMKWAIPLCVGVFCLSSSMVYILLGGV